VTTIRVEVTAEDINRGEPGSCKHCPIALAMDRALAAIGIDVRSWVILPYVRLGPKSANTYAVLPPAALVFAKHFDGEWDVEPFSFDLELPDELSPAEGPAMEEV
jgi:hypothetical protein